jgi:hypothetical protein
MLALDLVAFLRSLSDTPLAKSCPTFPLLSDCVAFAPEEPTMLQTKEY